MGHDRSMNEGLNKKVCKGNRSVPGRSAARCRRSWALNRQIGPKRLDSQEQAISSSRIQAGADDSSCVDGFPQVARLHSDSGKNLRI